MTEQIVVSIIMPAYNAGKFIAESIVSVTKQTFQEWELIIVDDGSTDNTASVVNKYLSLDSRIKYIYQHNGKQGKARNNGILNSSGYYIAFLDSDDLWHPKKLELQIEAIKRKNVDLVFSDGYFLDPKGVDMSTKSFNTIKGMYDIHNAFDLFLEYNRIPILTVLVKKASLVEVGLFTEDINIQNAEDYHLWLKLLLNNCKFYGITEKLAYYRLHEGQSTSQDTSSTVQAIYALKTLAFSVDKSKSTRIIKMLNIWYTRLIYTIDTNNKKQVIKILNLYIKFTNKYYVPKFLSLLIYILHPVLYKKILYWFLT